MAVVTLEYLEKHLVPSCAVLVTGGFDPLHYGHVRYFQSAAKLAGEYNLPVVVGVAPDSYIARKHPLLQKLEERMEMLDSIRWVDYVVPQQEETAATVIRAVRPRIFLKGDDWQQRGLPKIELDAVNEVGAQIHYVPVHPVSSSDILRSFFWSYADQMTGRA